MGDPESMNRLWAIAAFSSEKDGGVILEREASTHDFQRVWLDT